ncbi:olfactory receptor 14J1-like isoform X2, partial [Gallus gallus]|uniref:olfactory receptor 14J1-like isoform X2 n=1 Tax=Gallus gallus TaxID=9031 RepID=UPI001F011F5F
ISEFLLLALADTRQLQLLHFWLLLGIYLAALLGNGLISTAVACDHRLHTPMYFFLLNLALLDLGCISTTLPKAMANALWDTRHISYAGCAAQVFFFFFLFSSEYYLLTVMSYDRYVAICKPLILKLSCSQSYLKESFVLVVSASVVSGSTLAYLKPPSISSPSLDVVVAVLYTVVPPVMNPIIYIMRNQEIKQALRTLFGHILLQHH